MAAFVLVAAIAPSQIVLQWCPDDPHTLWGLVLLAAPKVGALREKLD